MTPPAGGYHDPYDDGYDEEHDPRFFGDAWKQDQPKPPEEPEPSTTPAPRPRPRRRKVRPTTRAEIEAALAQLDAGQVAKEPRALSLLVKDLNWNNPAWVRLRKTQEAAERLRLTRRCTYCRDFFTADQSGTVTCKLCKARGRKRCSWCGKGFRAEHGRVKRCPACLAKAAELDELRHSLQTKGRRSGRAQPTASY